ncbi:MAG: hypothetical protein L6Q92_14880 [Phycisphaerae bacterium]|nr:hypothetical protein [Phycisphaerae bacterium]
MRRTIITSLGLVALVCGCQQLAIMTYHATGGDTIEAKFKLTTGRVAVVFDDYEGLVTVPQTFREFQERLRQNFIANDVKTQLIPFEEWRKLQQGDATYDGLSVREIGEKLGADQVLHLRVTDFRLRREPAAPIFNGRFAVRVSVISTERKREVRLWPTQEGGEEIVGETHPEPADGDTTPQDVARQLAADLADKVAKLFYAHKEKS